MFLEHSDVLWFACLGWGGSGSEKGWGRDLTYFFPDKLVRSYEIVTVEILTEDEPVGRILANISYELY